MSRPERQPTATTLRLTGHEANVLARAVMTRIQVVQHDDDHDPKELFTLFALLDRVSTAAS